jgi:hypothetical protein
MGLLIDSNKENVNTQIMYIEEKKKQGSSIFHFVRSEDELKDWQSKGYKLEAEITPSPPMPQQTGMPIQKTDENRIIHVLYLVFRRMSWKDQNAIYSKCLRQITNPAGVSTTELDGIMYRDLKLKTILKRWNIMNDMKEDVKVSPETIDMLVPEVASEILNTFEKITENTE